MMKIAIAITGASGAIYAAQLLQDLQLLNNTNLEVKIVMSKQAPLVWETELGNTAYLNLPFKIYENTDFLAPFASGSAGYDALVICPCSMGTLGRIANGISESLITRAADVMLKERKKLICVIREMPYNLIQLNNMRAITQAGGIICPASPSFYSRPQSIEGLVQTVTHRVIDLLGLSIKTYRWGNEN